MPNKRDPYSTYGQKLISVFARLLFSGEPYSLIELSRMLRCSKQTVLRLMDDIRRSYGVEINESLKGRKKYYQIRRQSGQLPPVDMTNEEILVLQMCRAFTEHLLGRKFFEESAVALGKSRRMLKDGKELSTGHFASFIPGTIDYTPHHETILTLFQSLDEKRICKVSYRNVMARKDKTFYIKPFKLFSHRDTIYLHAGLSREPGEQYREPDFDPLLAVHRIRGIQMTDRSFTSPDNYNFERDFNQTFGIVKQDVFKVEVLFHGWAARYIAERSWSPEQKIIRHKDSKVRLKFQASSEPEVISWVLSFKDEAKVIKPKWLATSIKHIVRDISNLYE